MCLNNFVTRIFMVACAITQAAAKLAEAQKVAAAARAALRAEAKQRRREAKERAKQLAAEAAKLVCISGLTVYSCSLIVLVTFIKDSSSFFFV